MIGGSPFPHIFTRIYLLEAIAGFLEAQHPHDLAAYFNKLSNMELPPSSNATWSLHDLIWRMILGLEDWLYPKAVSKADVWFIFILTLGTDPWHNDLG